jgi:hypothetical protein
MRIDSQLQFGWMDRQGHSRHSILISVPSMLLGSAGQCWLQQWFGAVSTA